MLNLIRMDLARIFKSKSSLYIFLGMVLAFILTLGLVHYTVKEMPEMNNTESSENLTEDSKNTNNGVYLEVEEDRLEDLSGTGEDFVISSFSQTTYLIFLVIFGSLFFTSPYANGFIKNFLGMVKSKPSYIIATFLVAAIYVSVSFAIGAGILTIGTPFINEGMFEFTDYGRLFKVLAVELLSHLSYLSFILLIANLTRSTPITLMISFLYPTILFNFLVGIGGKILGLFVNLPDDFNLASYLNIGNIMDKSFYSTNDVLTRSVIVALVICAISLVLSSVIIKKKDI